MGTNPEIGQHYPKLIALDETLVQTGPQFLRLKPGGSPQTRQVPLRLMGAGDRARILEFAHGLPDEDLLFLRSDISDPAAVDDWIKDIKRGTTVTLLAEPDDAGNPQPVPRTIGKFRMVNGRAAQSTSKSASEHLKLTPRGRLI